MCGDSVRPDCGGWGGKPGAALPPREPCRRRGETRTLGWWRRPRRRGRERAEPRRPVRSAKPEEARHPRPRPKHTHRGGSAEWELRGRGGRVAAGGRRAHVTLLCFHPSLGAGAGGHRNAFTTTTTKKKIQGLPQRAQKLNHKQNPVKCLRQHQSHGQRPPSHAKAETTDNPHRVGFSPTSPPPTLISFLEKKINKK